MPVMTVTLVVQDGPALENVAKTLTGCTRTARRAVACVEVKNK